MRLPLIESPPVWLAIGMLAFSACAEPKPFAGEDMLGSSSQHVLVIVESEGDTAGLLYRYSATDSEAFVPVGDPIPINVGAGGVGKTHEGDKRAPSGAYPLTAAFGYGDTAPPGLRIPYVALRPETECVDDETSAHYNQIVNPTELSYGKTWKSSEMMRRDVHSNDQLYKLGLLVGYNPGGARDSDSGKGAGSCIFMHIWRGPGVPTVGCTSMSEENLSALMVWLNPAARPLLVQGSREELQRLAANGHLPYPVPLKRLAG